MKLKSTLLLLCLFPIFVYSQTSSNKDVNVTFTSSGKEGFKCGGRLVNGQLLVQQELLSKGGISIIFKDTVYAEDNKFFLQITDLNDSGLITVFAIKNDIGRPGNALFQLPENLKVGNSYKVRMGATNPAILSSNYNVIDFGIANLPLITDLTQEVTFSSIAPQTNLQIPVKLKGINKAVTYNQTIYIKLSDGSSYENFISTLPNTISLPVLPKDSINIYKITEITSSCGVVGEAINEARAIKRGPVDKLSIKNDYYTCHSSTFVIDVSSSAITPKTVFQVEFSKDETFKTIQKSTIATINSNNQIVVDLAKFVNQFEFNYVRVTTTNPVLTSNISSFYTMPLTQNVSPYISTFNNKEIEILFGQEVAGKPNESYYLPLKELMINGENLIGNESLSVARLKIPMPQKDSTLSFSKISTSCGNLIITKPELVINPSKFTFLNVTTTATSVCEGNSFNCNFDISGLTNTDDFNIDFNVLVSFKDYSQPTSILSNYSTAFFLDGKITTTINKAQKSITVNIPKNFNELITKDLGNRKIAISRIELLPSLRLPSNKVLTYNNYYFNSPKINLLPRISLNTSTFETNGIGFIEVPVSFVGSSTINYSLSNGVKGQINHEQLTCESNCDLLLSGQQNLRLFVEKSLNLKFESIQNQCGVGTGLGEAVITLKSVETPKIVIDETKISNKVCRGSVINIPFQKFGNWDSSIKLKLLSRTTDYNNISNVNQVDITVSPFKFEIPSFSNHKNIEIWIESANGIKSNILQLNLESKPYNLAYSFSSSAVTDYSQTPETTYMTEDRNYIFFTGNGANLNFKLNNIERNYTYNSNNYSYLNTTFTLAEDTTFYLNTATNSCGITEFNKTLRIVKAKTLINNLGEVSERYRLLKSECSGSEQLIAYDYFGIKPNKDSLVVQLAKYNNLEKVVPEKLKFFDVLTKKSDNELKFTIPDSCAGSYVYRIRSIMGNSLSNFEYLSFIVKQKPTVTLTTPNGQTDVLATPQVKLQLKGNLEKVQDLRIILNDGSNLSLSDFGVLTRNELNQSKNLVPILYNNGRNFAPITNTTYSIKTAYNACGIGNANGSVKVVVPPTIIPSIQNSPSSNTFCAGDSLLVDLKYFGNFPKDTLMGIYLHTDAKTSYNYELNTFKNNPNSLRVKLPNDINQGYYFVQIRKKSRNNKYFSGNLYPDSLAKINSILSMDSPTINIRIATAPAIMLSGNSEIYAGNGVKLNILPVNNLGINTADSKDTINFIYGLPYYYVFTNGDKFNSIDGIPYVFPNQTTSYKIASVKNSCGIGEASGTANVTVINTNNKRIEILGFYRKYLNNNIPAFFYESSGTFCGGKRDSLDIKTFGLNSPINISAFKVLLSDKNGVNYNTIPTFRSQLIGDSSAYKIIRLSFEIPNDLVFGYNYQLKVLADDATIPSNSLTFPLKIHELPTANLSGNAILQSGENLNVLIKLTGDAPWSISVVDKEGKLAYNGLPTKVDSSENFKNYQPKLIYDKELKLELNPEKSTSYKVSKVTNKTCGLGKVLAGEFTVDLILANENPIQNLIQIYPNPTANQLNIDLTNLNAITELKIFDSTGQLLDSKTYTQSQTHQKQSLDFSQYQSGVYLIKINTEKLSQVYRVVKH